MKRSAVVLLGLLMVSLPLRAQEKSAKDTVYHLEPVTVTATHATERVSPVTFSNLTRLEIRQRYSVQDVPVLLSDLPSITFYSENGNGMGYNYINLRGFDQRRLSVMVNGVPQNDPEDHNVYWIDFPDLLASTDNIQVQRGAGSAFYGPPAIGGSVNLLAVPFKREPGITLESMVGFQEIGATNSVPLSTRKLSATINSGLVDGRYMFYGRLAKLSTTGYRENGWVDLNSYFLGAARVDETMTTRIHLYGGPFADGLVYNGLPKSANSDLTLRRQNLTGYSSGDTFIWTGPRRPQELENFSQPHVELLHDWKLNASMTLSNTIFYIQGDGFYDYDASWADTTMLRLGTAYGYPMSANPANALVRAFVGNTQWGWLPRLTIDHGIGTLTVGAEVRIHRSLHWGKIHYAENLPAGFDPDYRFYEYNGKKDMLSLYAHELYRLRDDVTMMADLQFAYNRYAIDNEKFLHHSFGVPYYFLNPRFGVNYNINDQWNAYASAAYTSREPRLRNLYAAEDAYWDATATPQFEVKDTTGGKIVYDFSKPLVKPERLFDMETGSSFQDEHVQATANLFWMEFSDELVKSGKVDIFGQPVTGNADRTRHVGIELQGAVNVFPTVTVSGNLTRSWNRLVNYSIVDSVVSGTVYRRALDGNPIAGFPDLMGNLRITRASDVWTASLEAKYVGSFYTDNFKNEANKNDAYLVLNAEALYTIRLDGNFALTVRGEVRNLFNALFTMSGEGNAFFPAAERNYILGVTVQM